MAQRNQEDAKPMTISVGDKVPSATLLRSGENGYESFDFGEEIAGKHVVIFGVPGAYTATCTQAHMPSFVRTHDDFMQKGIEAIYCIAVNDIQVLSHWADATGARAAGIHVVSDWNSEWTKAAGLEFSAPAVGFIDRCQRCAMIVNNGMVEVMQMETERGVCNMTAGETLLELV